MKRNYIPAIIMLSAGLIDAVISIYYKLDLMAFTKRLLLVLLIFYILGLVVKIIVDINFPVKGEADSQKEAEADEESESDLENIDTDNIL